MAQIEAPLTEEQRLKMSYDEFLAWTDDTTHAEWVDGEVIVFMPPKDKHQAIVGFLHIVISLFANLFNLGIVRVAPFEMRARPDGPAREPDVLFIAREHLERLTPDRLAGPADLIVEVVSDSSLGRDRGEKFYEYQEAGVREYWIVDPRPGKERVDLYWLTAENRYQATLPDAEGRYHAVVLPGFWFRPDWLWQDSTPDPLFALAEMRGLDPEALQTLRNALMGQTGNA